MSDSEIMRLSTAAVAFSHFLLRASVSHQLEERIAKILDCITIVERISDYNKIYSKKIVWPFHKAPKCAVQDFHESMDLHKLSRFAVTRRVFGYVEHRNMTTKFEIQCKGSSRNPPKCSIWKVKANRTSSFFNAAQGIWHIHCTTCYKFYVINIIWDHKVQNKYRHKIYCSLDVFTQLFFVGKYVIDRWKIIIWMLLLASYKAKNMWKSDFHKN